VIRLLLRANLVAAAAGAAVLLGVFAVVDWRDLAARSDAAAEQQAGAVTDVLSVSTDVDVIRAAVGRTQAGARGDLAVRFADGTIVGVGHAGDADVHAALDRQQTVATSTAAGTVRLRPVLLANGSTAAVETFQPTWDVFGPLLDHLAIMVAGAVASVGIAGFVGYRRTRPLVDSVRAITGAATVIGQGRTGLRVPRVDAAEITALIGSLNAVSSHVDQLIASEREFVADLSHRLRTPLTALRLDSESIGDGPVAERVRRAVHTLDSDVDQLIRTAKEAAAIGADHCDVAKVAIERMAFWAEYGQGQGRRCEFDPAADCPAGDATINLPGNELGAVLDALLGNVFDHTPAGTPFAAKVIRYGGWVTLVIEDGGPGIADTDKALRRGTSGRGSTGLGLDIARHAVETTGGTIHVDRGRLGGARIRLRFAESGSYHADPAPKAWRLWSRSADLPVEPA
jgi:signal transduction histidine kinase